MAPITMLFEESAGPVCFRQAVRRQIDIGPSGETVGPVPFAFAVTYNHQLIHGDVLPVKVSRLRPA